MAEVALRNGKSTLLRMIAGLEPITGVEISIGGIVVALFQERVVGGLTAGGVKG